MMKIVFFGLGSIGQRHAKILLENYSHDLYAFRSGIKDTSNELGIKELHSWNEVEKIKPDIAFITNPTSLHIETAIKCAKLGCKLFIEKPIGKDLEGLDKLIEIVRSKNLVTYIAYNRRFHPVIIYLKDFLKNKNPLHVRVVNTSFYPNWREGRNHLEVYSAKKAMGGGVILDLSHEIDCVAYLLGEVQEIKGSFSKRGEVTLDSEDFVDMIVEANNIPVSIHINIISQISQWYIQIEFSNLSIMANLATGEVSEFRDEKLEKTFSLDYDRNQTFKDQIKYFFNNIDNLKIMNNLIEAESLFRKIIEFKNINE